MMPPTCFMIGDLGQVGAAGITIDRQRQGLAHADVVERLLCGVEDEQHHGGPWTLVHHEAVLGFGQKLIPRAGILAAELGVELTAEHPRHHRCVLTKNAL